MKLIFDNNISYKIIKKLDLPNTETIHVSNTSLSKPAADVDIWKYAKQNDYTIITFDIDFEELSILQSFPPKVILLKLGNSSTEFIANYLKNNFSVVEEFIANESLGLLKFY